MTAKTLVVVDHSGSKLNEEVPWAIEVYREKTMYW